MEANRKRSRGFLKGKLAPFYKTPKPSSPTVQYTTTTTTKVVKPNHSSPSPASVGFVVHQDYTISTKPNPKVSIVVADKVSHYEELYGFPADESVDTKAQLYISMVQQRLLLDPVDTESIMKFQDK